MIKQKGQSLIEVVFSIGVLVIVIAAVIDLVVKTTALRSRELQRNKASEMSEIIIENYLEDKKNHSDDFWNLTPVVKENLDDYDEYSDYTYSVDWTENVIDCEVDIRCVDAVITIEWGDDQSFLVKRFFSNKM
jgi:type II secretory pathway pseudopilin PulG